MQIKKYTFIIFLSILLAGGSFTIYKTIIIYKTNIKYKCSTNLFYIGKSLNMYIDSKKAFPPGAIPNVLLSPERRLSWLASLLPFIEGNPPFIPNHSAAWDDPSNIKMKIYDKENNIDVVLDTAIPPIFYCPSRNSRYTDNSGYGLTSYVGVSGLGVDAPHLPVTDPRAGVFGFRDGTLISQITDGLGTTMSVVETGYSNGPWTAAGYPSMRGLDISRKPYLGKGRQFGGLHRGGAIALFADGSVRYVRDSIEHNVFEAISTIHGGEDLDSVPELLRAD